MRTTTSSQTNTSACSRGYSMRPHLHRALCGRLPAATAACSSDKLNVPNYNNPTVNGVAKDPTGLQLLVTGLIAAERNNLAGFTRDLIIFGREGYNYFTTDGRTVSN